MIETVEPKVERSYGEGSYGHFVIEPLERGNGITLGNALRRVTLGTLRGAAVTQIKIEGASHEFSVIPHMKEDVVDFLLNIKAIRLRPLTNREDTLSLRIEGAGRVCAGDITPSANFEIVNPELHLATLESSQAKLCVEFTVELGKGYVPAGQSDGLPIGVISMDAIFSPARKVNYSVEPVRVGQLTGYERLILDIWTDGTLSASEALDKGAGILIDQFSVFTTPRESQDREEKKQGPAIPRSLYDLSIDQAGFTQSITRRLKRNRITRLGELLEMSRSELLTLDKFGAKSVQEVELCLKERDYHLAGAEEESNDMDVLSAPDSYSDSEEN